MMDFHIKERPLFNRLAGHRNFVVPQPRGRPSRACFSLTSLPADRRS